MQKEARTIYQAARFTTDYTQEKVAELLHISVESVRAYERGATIPPSDIVLSMIDIYHTPWLGYQHLRQNDPVGQEYLPNIEFRDLPSCVLILQKEMTDTNSVKDDLVDVACDGKVDKQEEARWAKVTNEIKELAGAALSMLFAPVQKEKTSVLLHRRQELKSL